MTEKLTTEQVQAITNKVLGDLGQLAAEKFAEDWTELGPEVLKLGLHGSVNSAIKTIAGAAYHLGFIEGVRHGHHAGRVALDEVRRLIDDRERKE